MTDRNRYFHIFRKMTEAEDDSLMEVLVRMQMDTGTDEQTAKDNALRCVEAVAAREALFEEVSEDAMAPMDRFFEKLAQKNEGERLSSLYLIHFGLTLYDDPAITGDEDPEQLFRDYLARQTASGAHVAPEMLEDRIRQALRSHQLSPAALRGFARKLRKSDSRLANSLALGESGRNLKCLMTMELWMANSGTMAMAEAANRACTGADYQAVADAVRKGDIARSVARKLLLVISVVAVLAAGICFMEAFEALMLAAEGAAATTATATAASSVPSFGSTLINYGPDYFKSLTTPGEHLFDAALSAIRGMAALFLGEAVLSKKVSDMAGACASWVAGLLHSAPAGADAVDCLADAVYDTAPAAIVSDVPDREGTAAYDREPLFF